MEDEEEEHQEQLALEAEAARSVEGREMKEEQVQQKGPDTASSFFSSKKSGQVGKDSSSSSSASSSEGSVSAASSGEVPVSKGESKSDLEGSGGEKGGPAAAGSGSSWMQKLFYGASPPSSPAEPKK